MNASPTSWNPFASRPWLWFVVAFVVFLAAWTAFFIIAAKNPARDIRDEQAPTAHLNH